MVPSVIQGNTVPGTVLNSVSGSAGMRGLKRVKTLADLLDGGSEEGEDTCRSFGWGV